MPPGQHYKIRLNSGRVLGPLNLERIRKLITRRRIVGTELARAYPEGEWRDINSHPEIAALLLAQAQGKLEPTRKSRFEKIKNTAPGQAPSATQVLPGIGQTGFNLGQFDPLDLEKTVVLPESEPTVVVKEDSEPTQVTAAPRGSDELTEFSVAAPSQALMRPEQTRALSLSSVSDAATQVIPGGSAAEQLGAPNASDVAAAKRARWIRVGAAIGLLIYLGLEVFGPQAPSEKAGGVFRPKLPVFSQSADPRVSQELYVEGLKRYVLDTVPAYQEASRYFLKAASLDPGNVKALALLASSYLNLIDASNKDENYFTVISKLIDLTRAKNVDLTETVIAEVEYLISANRAEAAQRRIVDYTGKNQKFGPELYYYLALAFYHRGDPRSAARYLSFVPDGKAFSPKVFYLKGLIAERFGDLDEAKRTYEKAVEFYSGHARSRLKLAGIHVLRAQYTEAAPQIEFIMNHPTALPPRELGRALYLRSQWAYHFQQWDLAAKTADAALSLDPENPEYALQLYQSRFKQGERTQELRARARMYFFLSEGEKAFRAGDIHRALTEFLSARQARDEAPLPFVKIGDMFRRLYDMRNALLNYREAGKRAPTNIAIWAKYVDALILNFEWDEAQRAMDRFRKLPVPQSAIDKLAGDLYARQNRHAEAQKYYKAAMSREVIDPSVYLAYGRSLMALGDFKSAPLVFALALRNDSFNSEALVLTAKCAAETESIERAILLLRDEIQKNPGAKAEFLVAIAELELKRGELERAHAVIEQAVAADPDYPHSYRVLGQYEVAREAIDKKALNRALEAYDSYLQRNPSDSEGYLRRYEIYIRQTRFEEASEELAKIYGLYPKYPGLRYLKGALFVAMGNLKAGVEEYLAELKNNPGNIQALVALGKALNEGGAPADALKYLNRAIQAEPNRADAKHQAGYSNYLLKNYPGAIALYEAALTTDKANPLIYKRLGLAYRDGGDPERAGQAFRKYLEMEPDAPDQAQFAPYR